MNVFDFVCGQLLSFEMMQQSRRSLQERLQFVHIQIPHVQFKRKVQFRRKDILMENQLLLIVFLVVGLLANMTVMTSSEQ